MNIAIIPARGNSKGIPSKNLQEVGGIPLITRAVLAAKRAEFIHEVVVSTQNDDIAKAAIAAGASIHMRPTDLCQDVTTSEDVLRHVLLQYHEAHLAAFLQCTSPFTRPETIDACMYKLEREHLDCVFTVAETHSGYWRDDSFGLYCYNYAPASARTPRQQAPATYRETGGVYALRVASFLERRPVTRFCGQLGMVEVEQQEAMEIDVPFDLQIARAMCDGSATKTSTVSLETTIA